MMSHTVTVSNSQQDGTVLVLNTGLFKTCPGMLKMLQLLLCVITTGVMGHYLGNFASPTLNYYGYFRAELFFLLMSVFTLCTTACIVISMTLSLGTAAMLPKTFFEVVYHLVAFVLLCAASITLLVLLNTKDRGSYRPRDYEAKLAAASLGLINSLLFLCSFVMAVRSWRLA